MGSLISSGNNEDKFKNTTRAQVETKATYEYLDKIGDSQTFDTVLDVVKHYSNYSVEKEEEIKEHILKLRDAANNVTKYSLIEGTKTYMKHPMVERYGEYAINLGIQNEMDTELNMSPEGKLRRKALH